MKIQLRNGQSVTCREVVHYENNTVDCIESIPHQFKLGILSYSTGMELSSSMIDCWLIRGQSTPTKFAEFQLSFVWKPDGEEYLTTGFTGKAIRWNANSGEMVAAYQCSELCLQSAAWSPDSKAIASVGWDNRVYMCNVETGEVQTLADFGMPENPGEDNKRLSWVRWSPDGKYLATTGWDGYIHIWEIQNDKLQEKFTLQSSETLLYVGCWSKDNNKLAVSGEDGVIRIWDVRTERILHWLRGHSQAVNALAWSENNLYLASGSSDGTVRVWDTEFGYQIGCCQTNLNNLRTVEWWGDSLLYGGLSNYWKIFPKEQTKG